MDPNACLDLILSAIRRNETEDAEEHADTLLGWLYRGGFEPRRSAATELARAMTDNGNDPDDYPTVDRLYMYLGDEDRE